ncbi:MAG: bifunctional nuclease family protein [Chloroflexi bacterium]|nr:bifunctional nuclease family protein [Chloroflexota bacterium]
MVEVVIDSVRVSLTNQQRIVVLREASAERYLPIWIGPYEAEAITIALQEIEVARPQTHDLVKNILNALNARILRIEVVALKEDVFYANLVIEVDGHQINVDSRPSDALALAVRAHVPVLVAREVMDSAGITPEQEVADEEGNASAGAPASGILKDEGEERLSVFEDFLQNLNLNDLSGSSKDDDEPDENKPDPDPKK